MKLKTTTIWKSVELHTFKKHMDLSHDLKTNSKQFVKQSMEKKTNTRHENNFEMQEWENGKNEFRKRRNQTKRLQM